MNYYSAQIPLHLASQIFGHTKSYPDKLLMPEVQACEFIVLSDGTAEISWRIRTDYDGTARMLPIDGPYEEVRLEITKERVLDCIAHSGIADVAGSGDTEHVVYDGKCGDVTEDFIKNLCWEHARELIMSYVCIFKINQQ